MISVISRWVPRCLGVFFGVLLSVSCVGGRPAAATPTAAPALPTATTLPLVFDLDQLLQTAPVDENGFVPCTLGPLELLCPAGGHLSQARSQMIWASSEALLGGFAPGLSGAQMQVSLFSVFDQATGIPEQVLAAYVKTLYPDGVPDEQLVDGPQTFVLEGGQTEMAAVIFSSVADDPRLVNVFLALEKNGRVATIGVFASVDQAARWLPWIVQGLGGLKFNVTPFNEFAHDLLPAGSTYALVGTASSVAAPAKLFANADQAIFIEVQPLDDADLMVELFDSERNVVAASNRQGKEYVYFDIAQAGQYDYRVTTPGVEGNHPYLLTLFVTDGVTIGAGARINAFACRLSAGQPIQVMAMLNPGEVADISVMADAAEQQLLVNIFSIDNLETPLRTASGADLELFTFEPPTPDWYVLSIEDQSGASGSCFVGMNYVKP